MKKTNFVIIFIFLLSRLAFGEDNIKILMEATPNPASLNSQIVLSIEINSNKRNLPNIPAPDLSTFKILGGPSTSSSISIVNFKTQVTKTYTYYLLPKKIGKFKINPISIKFKGKVFSSNSLTIEVAKSSENKSNQKEAEKDIFIKTEISSQKSFPYQQLMVTYKLYIRGRIESANIVESPDYKGFWTENFPKSNKQYQEMLGNKRYTVYDIDKKALFPLKEGEITISPYKLQVGVPVQNKRRRSNDPFDFFGDMSFFGRQTVKKIISSEELKIKVNPLPKSIKEHEDVLVGNFSLKINSTNFKGKINDAITLKFTLSGNGYLKSIKELPIKFSEQFEVYEPKIKDSYSYSGSELYSSKSFEYILIPRQIGKFYTPKSSIIYFNPTEKKYKELKIPAINFKIDKGNKKLYSNQTNENVGIEIGKDIRFIKEEYSKLNVQNKIFFQKNSYWLLWILLIIGWVIFYKYNSYYKKISYDTGFYLQQRAVKFAKKRMAKAIKAKDEGDFDKFLEETYKSVTGFIANKLKISENGITTTEIINLLRSKGIDEPKIETVKKILQSIEYYRFSPVSNKAETMDTLIENSTTLIAKLHKVI